MTKHTLVPNNFYFMKPNKIVKRQISLMAKPIWLPINFFFSKPIWILFVHHLLWIKKKKTKARSEEWRCMHLKMVNVKQITKPILKKKKKKQNKKQNPRRTCLTTSKHLCEWLRRTAKKKSPEAWKSLQTFLAIFSQQI